jgi:molybdate transport system regulatory protein
MRLNELCKSSYDKGMPARKKTSLVEPRFRIYAGREIALGPGKADLLAAIDATGSIQKGAAKLKMSYMRAWNLVRIMNGCFRCPLVEALRGGKSKGGAQLTPLGKKILSLYLTLETKSLRATASIQKQITAELK